jgi:phosphatidylserine decarboxylase
MAALRKGDASGAPHEILDPRDLKFCGNLCDAHWEEEDDPFRWRERLPLARWGLAELLLMGVPLAAISLAVLAAPWPFRLVAVIPLIVLGLVVYFFRDPSRTVPLEPNLVVAPADGKLVEITELVHDEFLGGPAVRVGIFLSLFNVHINRSPQQAQVLELRYHPGEFLNAMDPESSLRNESMWIGLESREAPGRKMILRQISGLVARRIVCPLRPGQIVERGEKIGMIKLGSRTELILPAAGLQIEAKLGDKIKAGATILGRYEEQSDDSPAQAAKSSDVHIAKAQ